MTHRERTTIDRSSQGDGKEIALNTEKLNLRDIGTEVDRISRTAIRQAELTAS